MYLYEKETYSMDTLKISKYIMYLLSGALLFMGNKYENENLLSIHLLILFVVIIITGFLTLKTKKSSHNNL